MASRRSSCKREDDLETWPRRRSARRRTGIGMAGGDGSQAIVAAVASSTSAVRLRAGRHPQPLRARSRGRPRRRRRRARRVRRRRRAAGRPRPRSTAGCSSTTSRSGVYAEIVQPTGTATRSCARCSDMIPDLLGPGAAARLRFADGAGTRHETAQLMMVSNNPYALDRLGRRGSRPGLDAGHAGRVRGRRSRTPAHAAKLFALETMGRAAASTAGSSGRAPSSRCESHGPIEAGVDGEAMSLEPPLRFESVPDALTVLLPPSAGRRSRPPPSPAGMSREGHRRSVGARPAPEARRARRGRGSAAAPAEMTAGGGALGARARRSGRGRRRRVPGRRGDALAHARPRPRPPFARRRTTPCCGSASRRAWSPSAERQAVGRRSRDSDRWPPRRRHRERRVEAPSPPALGRTRPAPGSAPAAPVPMPRSTSFPRGMPHRPSPSRPPPAPSSRSWPSRCGAWRRRWPIRASTAGPTTRRRDRGRPSRRHDRGDGGQGHAPASSRPGGPVHPDCLAGAASGARREAVAGLAPAGDPPRGAATRPACNSACSEHLRPSCLAGVDQRVGVGVSRVIAPISTRSMGWRKVIRDQEATGPGHGVAQANRPVMLDQDEGSGGVVRDLIDETSHTSSSLNTSMPPPRRPRRRPGPSPRPPPRCQRGRRCRSASR